MLYTEWNIEGQEPLKLRLRAKDCMQIEKTIGTNPLNVLMKLETREEIPDLTSILVILHASMQCYHHGIKMDDVSNYYDAYIEAGGSQLELLEMISDLFEASGLLPKNQGEDTEKNVLGAN